MMVFVAWDTRSADIKTAAAVAAAVFLSEKSQKGYGKISGPLYWILRIGEDTAGKTVKRGEGVEMQLLYISGREKHSGRHEKQAPCGAGMTRCTDSGEKAG